jgi:hypothetical protein
VVTETNANKEDDRQVGRLDGWTDTQIDVRQIIYIYIYIYIQVSHFKGDSTATANKSYLYSFRSLITNCLT